MLQFYPMDGETDIGFVEVPVEFESWLIAVSGISFEDVSLAVLGEEDGDIELIMDYDDYMNLCDLYYEYDTLGWMILEDPEYVEEINAIPDYDAEEEVLTLSNKAIAELIESQFWTDWTTSETSVNPGWWNLTISVRDLKLWSRGIKPNRFWKVSDAKKYFNIRGGKESLVTQIEAIQQFITGLTEGDSDATTQFQETVDMYFEAEGSSDKMTFGTMEWRWDTDEEDVDEDAINKAIEIEIRSLGRESGSGTLELDNEDGDIYEIYYAYDHTFSGYNTAETGYYAAETFEAPYAGLGSLFKFGDNQSALGGFTAKELTESSAIHGDFDSASLNYSGKQNLEVRQAETFDAHTRHNINRFTTRNNPHTKISNTRRKLKQQMWTDTAATVGIKGLLGIIAVVAIGVIAWKKK